MVFTTGNAYVAFFYRGNFLCLVCKILLCIALIATFGVAFAAIFWDANWGLVTFVASVICTVLLLGAFIVGALRLLWRGLGESGFRKWGCFGFIFFIVITVIAALAAFGIFDVVDFVKSFLG